MDNQRVNYRSARRALLASLVTVTAITLLFQQLSRADQLRQGGGSKPGVHGGSGCQQPTL